jgi:SAM-dependent methyltransferase
MGNQKTKRAAKHWGQTRPNLGQSFYTFPALRDYFFTCVTGRPSNGDLPRDWIECWTIDTFLREIIPVENCLSLCCGFGEIERILARAGVFNHCTGVDLAAGAIAQARQQARQAGYDHIDYQQMDINSIVLESEKYDLIWANGALHHLENLEHVLAEIYKALKPGGYFVANEYIGPKHQKLGRRQREIINSVIHLIPERLRNSSEDTFIPTWARQSRWVYYSYWVLTGLFNPDDYAEQLQSWPSWKHNILKLYKIYTAGVGKVLRPKRKGFRYGKVWDLTPYVFKVDPSEGIRADEIIPILRQTFAEDDLDVRYYNGSVLFYALDRKFYREFDAENPEDRRVLDMLIKIERSLIAAGELKSDNAHIIARKKPWALGV